jgi:hypothetical protein
VQLVLGWYLLNILGTHAHTHARARAHTHSAFTNPSCVGQQKEEEDAGKILIHSKD